MRPAVILALLSLGYYVNAAFGQNALALKVFGKLRYVVSINLIAALISLGLSLWLIPRYGALGAAVSTCGTLVVHNLLKQAGLSRGTGVRPIERRYLGVYTAIIVAALSLLALQIIVAPPLPASLAFALVASGAVVAVSQRTLRLEDTFPELVRIVGIRRPRGT